MVRKTNQCHACGICIGPKFTEHSAYPIGDHKLCGSCFEILSEQGQISLLEKGGYKPHWLHSDGTVTVERHRK